MKNHVSYATDKFSERILHQSLVNHSTFIRMTANIIKMSNYLYIDYRMCKIVSKIWAEKHFFSKKS